VRMSNSSVAITAAPLLGAHNSDVYGDLLGLDDTALARLKKEQII